MRMMRPRSMPRYMTEAIDEISVARIFRIDSIDRASLKRRMMRNARSTESGKGILTPPSPKRLSRSKRISMSEKKTTTASKTFIESLTKRRGPRPSTLMIDSSVKMPVKIQLRMLVDHHIHGGR